jgi:hypothetical protein
MAFTPTYDITIEDYILGVSGVSQKRTFTANQGDGTNTYGNILTSSENRNNKKNDREIINGLGSESTYGRQWEVVNSEPTVGDGYSSITSSVIKDILQAQTNSTVLGTILTLSYDLTLSSNNTELSSNIGKNYISDPVNSIYYKALPTKVNSILYYSLTEILNDPTIIDNTNNLPTKHAKREFNKRKESEGGEIVENNTKVTYYTYTDFLTNKNTLTLSDTVKLTIEAEREKAIRIDRDGGYVQNYIDGAANEHYNYFTKDGYLSNKDAAGDFTGANEDIGGRIFLAILTNEAKREQIRFKNSIIETDNNNQRIKDHDGGIVSDTTYVKYTEYLANKSVLFTSTKKLTKEGIEIRDKMIESDGGYVQFFIDDVNTHYKYFTKDEYLLNKDPTTADFTGPNETIEGITFTAILTNEAKREQKRFKNSIIETDNNNQRIKDHDGGTVGDTTYVKYTEYLANKSVLFTSTKKLTKEGIEIRDKMIESDGGYVQFFIDDVNTHYKYFTKAEYLLNKELTTANFTGANETINGITFIAILTKEAIREQIRQRELLWNTRRTNANTDEVELEAKRASDRSREAAESKLDYTWNSSSERLGLTWSQSTSEPVDITNEDGATTTIVLDYSDKTSSHQNLKDSLSAKFIAGKSLTYTELELHTLLGDDENGDKVLLSPGDYVTDGTNYFTTHVNFDYTDLTNKVSNNYLGTTIYQKLTNFTNSKDSTDMIKLDGNYWEGR